MKELAAGPGPKVGLVLNCLLAEVLDDPTKNTRDHLMERIKELDKQSPEALKSALDKIEKAQEEEDKKIMEKHYV